MTFTPEQIEAGTYGMTVAAPAAKAAQRELARIPFWRLLARRRALRRYQAILGDWEDRLQKAGLI